jgi:hypothetical protein
LGWVAALDCEGRTIWIVDAHRDDGKRFVVRADEKLAAFLELQRAVCILIDWTNLAELKSLVKRPLRLWKVNTVKAK